MDELVVEMPITAILGEDAAVNCACLACAVLADRVALGCQAKPQRDREKRECKPIGEVFDRNRERESNLGELVRIVDDDGARQLGEPAIHRNLEECHDDPGNPEVESSNRTRPGDQEVDDNGDDDCR